MSAPTRAKVRSNRERYSVLEPDAPHGPHELRRAESALIRAHLDPARRTVEAGTGGGRIVRGLQAHGFTDVEGFDFLPEMVEKARADDATGTIRFEVHDAAALGYPDRSFGQAVYLDSLLALIESPEDRRRALREASRVLEPGGVFVLSVPCYDGPKDTPSKKLMHSPYRTYLAALRRLRRSEVSPQELPPLRLAGQFNPGFLLDHGPYHYWFRPAEIVRMVRAAGFRIDRIGSRSQVEAGAMSTSPECMPPPSDNFVYLVCSKPG